MNNYRSEALTLRTYEYGESHRIGVFLTRRYGKVRGVAYGAKGARSRFSAALEPLTRVQLLFSRKENQELGVVDSCEIMAAFPAYQYSWEVNIHFSYFVELLTEFSREEEDGELLFRLTGSILDAAGVIPIGLLSRYFELWVLRLEGVLPRPEEVMAPGLAQKVRRMMRLGAVAIESVNLSETEIKTLERLCGELIEYHLERPLKTTKLVRTLS